LLASNLSTATMANTISAEESLLILSNIQYDLKEEVGSGRYARCWKAREKSSRAVMAIKQYRQYDDISKERCSTEGAIMDHIRGKHPHIITAGIARLDENSLKIELPLEYAPNTLSQLMERTKNERGLVRMFDMQIVTQNNTH
jgi:Protein kinase domain